MGTRAIYHDQLHAHFVTFSCYRRRRLLDHVHAIVWFPIPGQLSVFIQQWERLSSYHIRRLVRSQLVHYAEKIGNADDWPFSSARYYEQGRSVGVPIRWIA